MVLPRRSSILLAVLLGAFFLALYLLTGSSDLKHNGDTDLRYQTTQAIVDYHRLWIADPMWKDTRTTIGLGHHLYAYYAPGQTLLMVPLYIAGKAIAHHLSLPYDITTQYTSRSLDLFLGALLAVLFFFMALSLGYSERTSAVLTLVFGAATVAWPDAQSALDQTQVDLLLLLAVFAVWNFAARGLNHRRWLLLAGLSMGLAVFTRYDALLFVPIIALYPAALRWREGRWRPILADWLVYAAAILPWGLLVLAWNDARFGSMFKTGLQEATLGEPPWLGFLGLTVSPGKGLLWYLPLLFLLPWAAPPFYRRFPALSRLFAALILIPLLFYSNILYWHGDPAWGPRYLYTSIPYLVLPLGEIFARWSRVARPLRLFTLLLIGAGIVLNVSAVSVTPWRFWYRLEVMEEHTSQPFAWGATHYHYYWNVAQSPIVIQLEDVYQVIRLDAFGDTQYLYTARPTVCHLPVRCLSNPADNYPLNTLAFWWADARHPLLGPHVRAVLALGLAGVTALALALLWKRLRSAGVPAHPATEEPDLLLSGAAKT